MKENSPITSNLIKIKHSLSEKGVIRTIHRIHYFIDGYIFDRINKIDTVTPVRWADSGVEVSKTDNASMYDSILVRYLRKLFRVLKIEPGKVLVDFGSGKGRVLLIASEFGFREVRGIEFSPVSCDIARKNCLVYKAKTKTNTEFTIVESDVLDYKIRDDEDIFYLYQPFTSSILKQVLNNLSESLLSNKRKILIIYCNPVNYQIVVDIMKPVRVQHLNVGNRESCFSIFEI